MAISYNKPWKLLINKNMNLRDMRHLSGVSSVTITKLSRNEYVLEKQANLFEKLCP
jgi:DNA-binding Xre family transcriptional regulator